MPIVDTVCAFVHSYGGCGRSTSSSTAFAGRPTEEARWSLVPSHKLFVCVVLVVAALSDMPPFDDRLTLPLGRLERFQGSVACLRRACEPYPIAGGGYNFPSVSCHGSPPRLGQLVPGLRVIPRGHGRCSLPVPDAISPIPL